MLIPRRWSAATGSPRISTTRMSGSSTRRSHCPASPRPRARITTAATSPARCFSTSTTSPHPDTSLPHMIPSPDLFAHKIGALGIGDGDKVVVYDSAGLSSAGRAWWMLRLFGHADVAVLDGGLPKWRAEGRPLTTAIPTPAPRRFTARFDPTTGARQGRGPRQSFDPPRAGGRRPRRRPLRRQHARGPARSAQRPHPGEPQPARTTR